ncbi:MAG: DUF4446 family protein [Candidatus Pristimantibacillus lignocellulolyticus]|uniref:DUF4446 family protein n=1 Tax=Candidatus Pristimantibacillus lignocellulolyticus TaxID=2994561 RepID=A0A9J6ZJR2_9BACL|nr:MAG: DUF4446 family protein [Candidatus Pristimantibacillus lignocellulolyticus]
MDWLTENIEIIVIVLIAMVLIQWIMMMNLGGKLKKLRKSYLHMMEGTGVENLEGVIQSLQAEQQLQNAEIEQAALRMANVEARVPQLKSNIAIKRYNAFSNTGSDMSFSVAITNDNKDGIVLTSIHSREGAYIYGKPVEKGTSQYSLTPEEEEVINAAK